MLSRRSEYCLNCATCNERSPLFNMLSNDELEMINDGRFEVQFNAGENIIKQGTAASHMIMLINGMAKLYLEGIDKKNLILDILIPFKFFGGPGVFTDMRYQYSVAAIGDSVACFIPTENVRKVIRSNPDFSEAVLRYCNNNSTVNFDRLISLTQKQMHGRMADTLIYLSETVFKDLAFTLNITRHEMGEMSNMTKESTTRILKEFESEDIISIDGKAIEILNLDKLKEIAIRG